jgi:putative OPT family oligopeptide transporter
MSIDPYTCSANRAVDKEKSPGQTYSKPGVQPYIGDSQNLPEITIKAVILGFILAAVMCAANTYLGLKVGLTVAASIPAAVISMVVLKFFRNSNILENNIVQTAASAGEVIAAAVAFTLPALIMMGYWQSFPFWTTTSLVLIGGLYGVLFSIPLRRAYVVESYLKFPEGIATGEVLKAGDTMAKGGVKDLMSGGIIAAVVKFAQSGLMIVGESIHYWTYTGGSLLGFGTGLSLVLLSAGYIIGVQVGASMLIGAFLAWVVGVPLYGSLVGIPEGLSAYDAAVTIWNSKIRMIGVGTMVVGGLWTLVYLIKPIGQAIGSSIASFKNIKMHGSHCVARTERDIPMNYILFASIILLIPLFFVFKHILDASHLNLNANLYYPTIVLLSVFTVVMSFICSSISGYMCGLVGSSNNPLSGVTIMAVLGSALLLFAWLSLQFNFKEGIAEGLAASAITIMLGTIVANAAAVSGDNLQDLKSGQIVGATPWKQQLMLIVGVVAGAFAMTPVIQILFEAYGMGNVLPREGMDPAQALGAPKAALMAVISTGVFSQSLDWSMFGLGGALAVIVIAADEYLQKTGASWRLPIMGVALGIYMPLDVTVPVFIGGVVASIVAYRHKRKQHSPVQVKQAENRGLLFCSGMIAGEALVGIALAIPFAACQSTDCFKIAPAGFEPMAVLLGTLVFYVVSYYLYNISSKVKARADTA